MARLAWLYARGQWSQITDLVDAAWPEDQTVDSGFKRALDSIGYVAHMTMTLGPETDNPILVYQAGPQTKSAYPFAFEITGLNSERIYVTDLPSFLEVIPLLRGLELEDYKRFV